MGLLAACGIEERPVHVLPEQFDMLRIAPDQSAGGLGQRVFRSAFTNADDSGVGLDDDPNVALVEERIWIWGQVGSPPRDLHLRKRGKHGQPADSARDCGSCQGPDKCPSFHGWPNLVYGWREIR